MDLYNLNAVTVTAARAGFEVRPGTNVAKGFSWPQGVHDGNFYMLVALKWDSLPIELRKQSYHKIREALERFADSWERLKGTERDAFYQKWQANKERLLKQLSAGTGQAEPLAPAPTQAQPKGNTMAKKKAAPKAEAAPTEGINKSALIRGYKQDHPEAKPLEIAEALTKQTGQEFKAGLVSTTLYQASKAAGKAAAPKTTKAPEPAKAATNGAGSPNDLLALDKALELLQAAGSPEQAIRLLNTVTKIRDAKI